jgi:hypothetical protein
MATDTRIAPCRSAPHRHAGPCSLSSSSDVNVGVEEVRLAAPSSGANRRIHQRQTTRRLVGCLDGEVSRRRAVSLITRETSERSVAPHDNHLRRLCPVHQHPPTFRASHAGPGDSGGCRKPAPARRSGRLRRSLGQRIRRGPRHRTGPDALGAHARSAGDGWRTAGCIATNASSEPSINLKHTTTIRRSGP